MLLKYIIHLSFFFSKFVFCIFFFFFPFNKTFNLKAWNYALIMLMHMHINALD